MPSAGDFANLAHTFATQTGSRQTHIPVLGLARLVVKAAHPAGASDLKLAVFEHLNIAAADFAALTDGIVGSDWKRLVRVRSRDGETTHIYLQPAGNRVRMLVATVDRSDTTFVEVKIRPASLLRFIDKQRREAYQFSPAPKAQSANPPQTAVPLPSA